MKTCSWCGTVKDKSNPELKSHGICEVCSEKVLDPKWSYNYETKKFEKREGE